MFNKTLVSLLILISFYCLCFAQDFQPYLGVINSNNINIRSDSTVMSKAICNVNKGERVEVILEKYQWYKIRLPKNAPAYIRKDLATPIDAKTVKISKDSVNIRLQPNEGAPIIGRAETNEIIAVLDTQGQWYKIEPTNNSFGWVYKKFINKAAEKTMAPAVVNNIVVTLTKEEPAQDFVIEGVVLPYGKVFNRQATHKLRDKEQKIYLLKGDKTSLNAVNYHKVKISAKLTNAPKTKYPLLEVRKIEILD